MSAFDNVNPQVSAMRDEVANTEKKLQTKQGLFKIAGGVVGAAGAAVLAPSLLPTMLPDMAPLMFTQGVVMGGALGASAGSIAGNYATITDKKKLEVNQRILDANIQNISNTGYWKAYNTEVAQTGELSAPVLATRPLSKGIEYQHT